MTKPVVKKQMRKVAEQSLLNLNLQFFGDEGAQGDQGQQHAGDQPGGQDPTQTQPPIDQPDNQQPSDNQPPSDQGDQQPGAEKLFTQESVNTIAAREARKAEEKLLKKLGVKDFKTAKEGLEKFNEYQDSQKTEAQKAADRAQQLEQENQTYKEQVETLQAKNAAFGMKVKPELVDDVIVLAKTMVNEETDISQAIEKVIEKHPYFKDAPIVEENKDKPSFSQGDHNPPKKPSEQEAWAQAFKW